MTSPQHISITAASPTKFAGVEPELASRAHRSSGSHSDDPTLSASHSRHSPVLKRNYDLDDLEEQERQRAMDVDSAAQLSRARSASVVVNRSSYVHGPNASPLQERIQERLSREDERPLFAASPLVSEEEHHTDHLGTSSIGDTPPLPPLDRNHEANMIMDIVQDDNALNGLPTYHRTYRSMFNFALLEDYALKHRAGPTSVQDFAGHLRSPLRPEQYSRAGLFEHLNPFSRSDGKDRSQDESDPLKIYRSRSPQNGTSQRRIGGKMALFEGNAAAPPPTFSNNGSGSNFGDLPTFEHFHKNLPETQQAAMHINTDFDQPFRFTFYSNTLSTTIHARSISELPAEGQSFEDLFMGKHIPQRGKTQSKIPTDSVGFSVDSSNQKDSENRMKHQEQADGELCTWWLDVTSPTDDEMKLLSKVFSIHPLTTEDIQMEETREKIELFRNYYLVCFRSFDQDPYSPTYLEPLNMYIIVFREGILSFHFHPTPHPQNVRRRIKQLKDYIEVTSDWISYALIDDITDAFGPLIQGIEYEVDSIDELVLILKEVEQTDMLRRIGTCRKKVMGLLRLMGNKADVVKGLAKRCNENWTVAPKSDIGLYLSDIQDHLITMTQNLNHYEKILSRSHSNYLAQISIEMTDANNQINDVLSKLTALGTVLIPMNLITGLWGMNVHVPGEDDQTSYTWFVSIIGGLAAFALFGGFLTYRLMIRRH